MNASSTTHAGRPARRLIMVDAENLLACEPDDATPACWEFAISSLLESLEYRRGHDHVVLGVHPSWAYIVAAIVPEARLVVRTGESGADLALCDELLDVDFIARRYDGVDIASGDHEFVSPAAALAGVGVPVTVAAIAVQASPVLTAVAESVVWLTRPARVLGADAVRLSLATAEPGVVDWMAADPLSQLVLAA